MHWLSCLGSMLRLNRLSGEINRWVFNETQDPQMYRLQGSYARIWAVSQVSSPHLWWRFSPRHLVTPWVWTSYDDQVGWDAYVVMHMLVLRVPLLMVVPLALQSLLIAAALRLSCTDFWPFLNRKWTQCYSCFARHACFISYGIFKEKLVTQDKVASVVLVLSSRAMPHGKKGKRLQTACGSPGLPQKMNHFWILPSNFNACAMRQGL